ncbi:MAG: hypothetical protein JNM63_02680, partial [Spirochaetia bacterium]|nr:hypothetical protein [Spirochaetia bacterium]
MFTPLTNSLLTCWSGLRAHGSERDSWHDHDAYGRMRSVTADGTTTTMVYDHTGERTRKAVSTGKVTDYVAGLAQVDSSGEVLSFVFDGINRIASVKKVGAVAQTFFMHTDQLGSTTLVTSGD